MDSQREVCVCGERKRDRETEEERGVCWRGTESEREKEKRERCVWGDTHSLTHTHIQREREIEKEKRESCVWRETERGKERRERRGKRLFCLKWNSFRLFCFIF
jgi:hypothetical protein